MADINAIENNVVIEDKVEILFVSSFQAEFRIRNFFSLPENKNFCTFSKFFPLGSNYLRFYFAPNYENGIGVGFNKKSSEPLSVEITIGIKNAYNMVHNYIQKISDLGSTPKSTFLGYIDKTNLFNFKDTWIPNGTLTFSCSFSLCDKHLKTGTALSTESHSNFLKSLGDLFLTGRGADVILIINSNEKECKPHRSIFSTRWPFFPSVFKNSMIESQSDIVEISDCHPVIFQDFKEFKAHRCILSARSPVFASMFENNMPESQSGIVEINDCPPAIFQDFLMFLYTDDYHCVTASNAPGLYYMADKYVIPELKNLCAKCMCLSLTIDSFCDIFYIAKIYNESEMEKCATDFFLENMKDIVKTQKWTNFVHTNVIFLNELLIKASGSVGKVSIDN